MGYTGAEREARKKEINYVKIKFPMAKIEAKDKPQIDENMKRCFQI